MAKKNSEDHRQFRNCEILCSSTFSHSKETGLGLGVDLAMDILFKFTWN
ncbi:hypothetical protein LCGC14_1296450 [marine sediment metagenome]|uniref:Uncharacterized protein n=1 Tax=marine sediment metagenome TaxID=412755 RepID=A0A0F9N7D1_9ZZZZ